MKLLIPLDQSDFSEAVLEAVRRTVLPVIREVHLLAVTGSTPTGAPEPQGGPPEREGWPQQQVSSPGLFPLYWRPEPARQGQTSHEPVVSTGEDVVRSVQDYLADAGRRLGGPGRAAYRVIESDDPARAIIDYARDERVDLIAMATHGRSGIARALEGSVTDAVIRSGVAPVLAHHPPERP